MAQVVCKLAQLHSPLFFQGKNFGSKLDPTKLTGLELLYVREDKELLVTYLGETAHIPNVEYYVPGEVKQRVPVNPHPTHTVLIKSAQVESPMSHVHAGPGHGKTK